MTLTHNTTLDWADAANDAPKHDGLSPFGERVVKEMNRLGMLVDISHVSPATMADALRVSQAPVIASHSSAYALCPSPRNVPDDILKAVKQNGGVIMVNFYSGFIVPEAGKKMRAVIAGDAAKYPDRAERAKAMQAWMNPTRRIRQGDVSRRRRPHRPYRQGRRGRPRGHRLRLRRHLPVAGRPGRRLDLPSTDRRLLRRGYSEADIHKILGGNVLRAFRQAGQVAKRLRATTRPEVDDIKAERRGY